MPTYRFPRPSVTVDAVVFGWAPETKRLSVLLIERAAPPFKGKLALPGGFIQMRESLEDAVRRELHEETGLKDLFLEQLYTFGKPSRDPRARVISIAYYALVNRLEHLVRPGSDAAEAAWANIPDGPAVEESALGALLAFDHAEILGIALRRLRGKLRYAPIGFELLPRQFSITQLQQLYEVVLGRPLDRSNFRKRILALGVLERVGVAKGVAHRPPTLYRFDVKKYVRLQRQGFDFEV